MVHARFGVGFGRMLCVATAALGGEEVGGVGNSRSREQKSNDRGAVLVEYALVLVLLLVGALGTIELLDQKSKQEVNHQADCISTRPPPPGCQPRTVTTLPPPIVPPTSAPTTTPPPGATGTASFLNGRIEDLPGGTWDAIVDASFQVDTDPVTPYGGATVRVRVTITAPANPTPFFIDCMTALDGTCELRFTTPAPGVTELSFEFETVEGFAGTVTTVGLPLTYTHPPFP